MSKKTVECNVIVMDTSAEGVTPILVVVEGTDEKGKIQRGCIYEPSS